MHSDNADLENSREILSRVQVIYEDDHVVVICKPSGLAVHGDGYRASMTLVDWILATYPEMVGVGENAVAKNGTPITRPGIVHRLDKETSGIMVLARTAEAYLFLKSQFMERRATKEYRAIVNGVPNLDHGTIDAPIGKSDKSFKKRSVRTTTGAVRDAVTEYETNETFAERVGAPLGYAFLRVFPKTGRMHQIRVHMAHIQHPIVCDRLYAPHRKCPLEMGRLALHAFSIKIDLPDGGRRIFEAPLPDDMTRFLAALRTGA